MTTDLPLTKAIQLFIGCRHNFKNTAITVWKRPFDQKRSQQSECMTSRQAETIKWSLEIVVNKFPTSIWDEVKMSKGTGPRATSQRGESGSVQGHRSSTPLSNQVFVDSRSHPWSRWKRCILNCTEAACGIVVMFFSGTFPLPVSPSMRRSTGHFAEGLWVHKRGW